MKISFSPNQLFDMVGFPLVSGRVTFFLHGSDTPATVYTMDGERFVEAQNPVVLDDAGSFPQTVFMEAAIYDVKVEKLTGSSTYSLIETYQYGFNMPDVTNDTVVQGMEGLVHANPELGFVTVVGYDNDVHCGARTYMWDAQCTDSEDGGAIVGSESVQDGRWILLSDLREMPSTYYGVKGGHESNLSNFISYPTTAGTYGVFLPPVPRFVAGTYTTPGTLSTTKTLSFDQGAKFVNARFTCIAAEISEPVSDYVADFIFLHQARAESSWFRTVRGFWTCGAYELHQSPSNHFADSSVGNTMYGIANRKISGHPLTMTGTGSMLLTACTIDDGALSTNWYITFQQMNLSDRWFADSNWNIGMSVSFRQYANRTNNYLDLSNFQNANVYLLFAAAWGLTSIDLCNRSVGTVTADMPFTAIRNAVIGEAHFDNSTVLDNVQVGALYLEHNYLNFTTKRCSLGLMACKCAVWNDDGSSIALGCDIDTTYTTVNWSNTSVNMSGHRIGRAADDFMAQKQVVMWRCAVTGGTIANTAPVFLDCNIADTLVYVHPVSWYDGAVMSWKFSMEFRGNRFNGAAGIRIGAHTGISDHIAEVYECLVEGLAISNNVFNTTVPGIACPFWSGENMKNRFIRGMTTYARVDPTNRNADYFPVRYEYKDNYGNCPRAYAGPTNPDLPGALAIASQWGTSGAIASGMYFENGQTPYSVFVLPALANPERSELPDPVVSSNVYSVSNLSVCTPYRAKALFTSNQQSGGCADFPTSGYLPLCAYDRSLPNDMFNCLVGSWGESAQFFGINPIEPGV